MNLTENLMISNGITISGEYSALSTYSIDTSNKVNGKSVYYHLDSNNLDNTDYLNPGQIILVNCNSSSISEINISYAANALALHYCKNASILDCNFSDNERGISLDYSNNNTISRNSLDNNGGAGIYLTESNHNNILENTVNYNVLYGIFLRNSDNNNVSENNINHSNEGGYL